LGDSLVKLFISLNHCLCILLVWTCFFIATIGSKSSSEFEPLPFSVPLSGAVEWVVIAYLVATAAVLLTAGRLADMIGRKIVWSAGLIIFTVGSAICGAALTLSVLIAARLFQGIGGALLTEFPGSICCQLHIPFLLGGVAWVPYARRWIVADSTYSCACHCCTDQWLTG
jgi:MFS family permease